MEDEHHHALHLFFTGGPGPGQRPLHVRVTQMPHAHAVRVRRKTQHAARVPHEYGGHGIFVRRPEFFDHHHVGPRRDEDVAQRRVQFAESPLERRAHVGRDDARFEQPRARSVALDRAVTRHPQARIDAENPHYGCVSGDVPLT